MIDVKRLKHWKCLYVKLSSEEVQMNSKNELNLRNKIRTLESNLLEQNLKLILKLTSELISELKN